MTADTIEQLTRGAAKARAIGNERLAAKAEAVIARLTAKTAGCWNCWSVGRERAATEPPADATQFVRETTQGLCDECRALAGGQPLSGDDLTASAEDWRENL